MEQNNIRKGNMNAIDQIKKCRISYNGIQVVLIKYISMRERMNNPVVSISEIISFNPTKFKRKDTILRTLEVMVKNNFVKKQNGGYVITNIGRQVPFVVADLYIQSLSNQGKRAHFALKEIED